MLCQIVLKCFRVDHGPLTSDGIFLGNILGQQKYFQIINHLQIFDALKIKCPFADAPSRHAKAVGLAASFFLDWQNSGIQVVGIFSKFTTKYWQINKEYIKVTSARNLVFAIL